MFIVQCDQYLSYYHHLVGSLFSLLSELAFPVSCHGPNSLTLWCTLVTGTIVTEAYCLPLFFAVTFPAGPTSLVIGRNQDSILPYSSTQSPVVEAATSLKRDVLERCTTCSKQTRSAKSLPLVQRSHLTLSMILKFFPMTSWPLRPQPHFWVLSTPSYQADWET